MKRLLKEWAFIGLLLIAQSAWAQSKITGIITDGNEALPGATVTVRGTNIGTITDAKGAYSLPLKKGTYEIEVRYIGYNTATRRVTLDNNQTYKQNFNLQAGEALQEVVVVGNRSQPRSRLDSPAPVDVIDRSVFKDAPQVNLNQLFNYVVPSFNSNTQVISDGTDHIDPASLRGLGPDQVLVLINGKRRHTTSLININGSYGKGSVGTDLNAIPVSAIKRIEILRDGASAQYGSDAIAGVINIILEDNTNQAQATITGGGYLSSNSEGTLDGETAQANANLGFKLGTKGGFINFTGSYDFRNPTNRQKEYTGTIFTDYNFPTLYPNPTGQDVTEVELARLGKTRADYVSRIGQSKNSGGSLFFNSELPLSNNATFYSFGGLNLRNGESAAFRRQPAQLNQNVAKIYPDGFLPLINTLNIDKSLAVGLRGQKGEWDIDFSNTYGNNAIDFTVSNTVNASLLEQSPTRFEAGGYRFQQNTTNLDFHRKFDWLSGLNLSFGGEYRYENYRILEGQPNSYIDYGRVRTIGTDLNGNPIQIPDAEGNIQTLKALNGKVIDGGAQAFPGFRPDNAIDASRSSFAAYLDTELDLTDQLLLAGALRFENYTDFGSTLNWKLALRYKLNDRWSLRAAASTGFRAPSLHQRYFSATSSVWTDGQIVSSGTFTNDSQIAQLLGIPKLKQEESYNYSAGLTGKFGDFSLTVDGYYVKINNRIIYTGQFKGSNATTASEQDKQIYEILRNAGAETARFFANAIDTETKGIDVVLSYKHRLGSGVFRADLSGTFVTTQIVGDVHASPLLAGKESTYLDHSSQVYIESAVPRVKGNLALSYNPNRWTFTLRNSYFGPVDAAANDPKDWETFGGRIVTDATVGYRFSQFLTTTVGANNLFDVYPARTHGGNTGSGYFLYSRTGQQFGFNGRYVFGRLQLTF